MKLHCCVVHSLTWTNAGHPLPLVCRGGVVREVAASKTHVPLGFLPTAELNQKGEGYLESRVRFQPGSKLVLFTDGLVEATRRGDRSVQFSEIVNETIVKLSSLQPRPFLEGLQQALVDFHGSEDFDDDICMICLDILPEAGKPSTS